MGMTIVEKILAQHAGMEVVEAGSFIWAEVDLAFGNDVTAPVAIKVFGKAGTKRVFDPKRIALICDHFVPTKDIPSAQQCRLVRDFAKQQGIHYFFECKGIEHALLTEEGLVLPGDLVIGADSHTCTLGALGAFSTGVGSTDLAFTLKTGKVWLRVPDSMVLIYFGKLNPWVGGKDLILWTIADLGPDGANYRALEFRGEAIERLSMADRFTLTNMAVEAGAKVGIIPPDATTLAFVEGKAQRSFTLHSSDEDAHYVDVREYDVSLIEPQVAFPHSAERIKNVRTLETVYIDQVVIGSCTNGRLEDLRLAAQVLRGKRVAPYMRLIVIPATQRIYLEALREGLIEVFLEAGAVIGPPTCGPCLGGHMGVLAEGERCITTTNRNFVGRMGHPGSEVYLANPAVAAATAIAGRIVHPEEVMEKEAV